MHEESPKGKKIARHLAIRMKCRTFAPEYGKVLYGMLPRNPPGLDRSKGTLVVAARCSKLSHLASLAQLARARDL